MYIIRNQKLKWKNRYDVERKRSRKDRKKRKIAWFQKIFFENFKEENEIKEEKFMFWIQ